MPTGDDDGDPKYAGRGGFYIVSAMTKRKLACVGSNDAVRTISDDNDNKDENDDDTGRPRMCMSSTRRSCSGTLSREGCVRCGQVILLKQIRETLGTQTNEMRLGILLSQQFTGRERLLDSNSAIT